MSGALPDLDALALAGTWHVVATTFPMWLKGDRRSPTFTYTPTDRPGRLEDRVRYQTRRGEGEIRGFDQQDPACSARFVWRGAGLLWPLSSEWTVLYLQDDVAALSFSKTLFTPAGLDVLVRAPGPDDKDPAPALAFLGKNPALAALVAALQPPAR